jgi:hypothetical protein
MDYLRQTKTLARFVLVWFALSLGVAMASAGGSQVLGSGVYHWRSHEDGFF